MELTSKEYNLFIGYCEKFIVNGIRSAIYYAIIGDKYMLNEVYKKINDATKGRSCVIFKEFQDEFDINFQIE